MKKNKIVYSFHGRCTKPLTKEEEKGLISHLWRLTGISLGITLLFLGILYFLFGVNPAIVIFALSPKGADLVETPLAWVLIIPTLLTGLSTFLFGMGAFEASVDTNYFDPEVKE